MMRRGVAQGMSQGKGRMPSGTEKLAAGQGQMSCRANRGAVFQDLSAIATASKALGLVREMANKVRAAPRLLAALFPPALILFSESLNNSVNALSRVS